MAITLLRVLKIQVRLLAFLPLLGLHLQTATAASAQTQFPEQHFACSVGYTQQECEAAIKVLRNVLARYSVDALGKWTWVLVRTEDWKQILSQRGFDTSHPAFSYLPKRETFLDGSLVARTSIRGAELSAIWRMPVEDLLDLAIRHELAHALCNELDETKAERLAVDLKMRTPLSCQGTVVAKSYTDGKKNRH